MVGMRVQYANACEHTHTVDTHTVDTCTVIHTRTSTNLRGTAAARANNSNAISMRSACTKVSLGPGRAPGHAPAFVISDHGLADKQENVL